MKNMKHTPGPWTTHLDNSDLAMNGIGTVSVNGPKGIVCCCEESSIEGTESNARLIAAAPEMLEALELVLNDNRLMNAMTREQARAILDSVAKARGGS